MPDMKSRIAEARELDKAGTKGPWFDSRYHDDDLGPHIENDDEKTVCVCTLDVPEQSTNSKLIARFRTLAPELADDLERVIAERDALAVQRDEAIDLAAEAIPYAGDYFDQKWGLSERLTKLQKAQSK